ncbi:uncharacterized protein LOC128728906 [Anopheles nili]|uniref:uncharacterized protein LOC128728906 n=1 Tax=Anopheles nili TaxID=185578 RepID=UPI00237BEA9A|nr:uncharacterized protein LOC128728906 [Anopheles nili]
MLPSPEQQLHGEVSGLEPTGKELLLEDVLLASEPLPKPGPEPDDDPGEGWLNTTTLLEGCSTSPPWWHSESPLRPDDNAAPPSATTGERSPGDARRPAAMNVCRNELDKTERFRGAETASVTVHDVCNKTISNGGYGGQFSSGARGHVVGTGSCSGSGTAAAAVHPAPAVASHPRQQPANFPRKPFDFSSISDSSSSFSVRDRQQQTSGEILASGGRPFAVPVPLDADGGVSPAALLAPLQQDIDWTNETDFTGHLWLGSPTNSSSSNITEPETTTGTPFATVDLLSEPLARLDSPVSLQEEIEQLSRAFDSDASNHRLVSTETVGGLAADDTEPVSINILKWLQDDMSSLATTDLPVGVSRHQNHQPSFEHALDRIHNIDGLEAGTERTAVHHRHQQNPLVGSAALATASASATNMTTVTATKPIPSLEGPLQRDHNYFTLKRRLQQNQKEDTGKHKAPKLLLNEHHHLPQSATDGGRLSPALAAKSAMHSVEKKGSSLASRKASKLLINVGRAMTKPADVAPENGAVLAPVLLHTSRTMTTTTTMATATSSYEPSLRVPPQATLNTPDLTNDILDLEDEKFDLLSFIDANDDLLDFNAYKAPIEEEKPTLDTLELPTVSSTRSPEVAASSDTNPPDSRDATPKPTFQLTLESLRQLTGLPGGAKSGGQRSTSRIGSLSSASSACGDSSSDVSSGTKAPKRRGRPPKTAGTVRDRSQYQHLSEADWRYREQRDKNNEASRKSRINRKDRELKLELEADRLNAQHQKLSYEERRLQVDCQRWRKAVMKLALL